MTEPVARHGALGPLAAAKLRALGEQIRALEEERTALLLLVAEAQGYRASGRVRFAWELEPEPRWTAAEEAP